MRSLKYRYLFLALLSLAGCGGTPVKTHQLTGTITLQGGDTAQLTGHSVEAALQTDPTVRAFGTIDDRGRFALETIQGGNLLNGATEGRYDVRIVLSDDDVDGKKPPKPALAKRFFQFKTSGLSLEVPAKEEVTLVVSSR